MERNLSKKPTIFNTDFVTSAIIPIIIFYVFNKFNMTLEGVTISCLWSICVVAFNFIKTRSINALAVVSSIISAIGLLGTLLSKNPTFYLVSPIIQDILLSIVFFTSLAFKRPLIQIIAEQSYFKNSSNKTDSMHNKIFRLLTCLWGVLSLIQGFVRIILIHFLSMSAYYAISTAFGNISTIAFISISVVFSKWYWGRKLRATK